MTVNCDELHGTKTFEAQYTKLRFIFHGCTLCYGMDTIFMILGKNLFAGDY